MSYRSPADPVAGVARHGAAVPAKLLRCGRKTVADLRALKGKRHLSMLFVDTLDEAAAASAATIDVLAIIAPVWTPPMAKRRASPHIMRMNGANPAHSHQLCDPASIFAIRLYNHYRKRRHHMPRPQQLRRETSTG